MGDEDRGEAGKATAVVALARKLAGILFALWRDGTEFGDRNVAVSRGREVGRDGWKREAGYRRSLAEKAMMRLKTIFSDRLKARGWKGQETELRVRCAAMNKITSLGMPQSYAV